MEVIAGECLSVIILFYIQCTCTCRTSLDDEQVYILALIQRYQAFVNNLSQLIYSSTRSSYFYHSTQICMLFVVRDLETNPLEHDPFNVEAANRATSGVARGACRSMQVNPKKKSLTTTY